MLRGVTNSYFLNNEVTMEDIERLRKCLKGFKTDSLPELN